MIYEIKYGNNTLFYPGDERYAITSGILHLALNDAGYLEFTMPSNNPLYNKIKEKGETITVLKNSTVIWLGEIREITTSFDLQKKVYVIGELAYLADTVTQMQYEVTDTPFSMLTKLINNHNSLIKDNRKKFQVGAVYEGTTISKEYEIDYGNTLDIIKEHITVNKKYIKLRYQNGTKYIDILPISSYGKLSTQEIRFGLNLLDYTSESTVDNIVTAVFPVGSLPSDTDYSLIDENKKLMQKLTIEGVNNGVPYVFNQTAVDNFGWIFKVQDFGNIEDASELKTAAEEYLKDYNSKQIKLELTAVDLSVLNLSYGSFELGDRIRCIAEPFGIDAEYPVRELEIDLLKFENNKIVLGHEGTASLTQSTASSIESIERELINPQGILLDAQHNAANMINANGKNGYVAIMLNDQKKPYEIVVMDAPNFNDATRAWRWNLNGFGYGTKPAGGDQFTWNPTVALTMDGAIVANYITAGQLNVGGSGNKMVNAINIFDSEGKKRLVYFDNSGMHLASDQKIDWTNINTEKEQNLKTYLDGAYNDIQTIYYADRISPQTDEEDPLWWRMYNDITPSRPEGKVERSDDVLGKWTLKEPSPYPSDPKNPQSTYYWMAVQTQDLNGNWTTGEITSFISGPSTTVITRNTITTSYVNALQVTAKTVRCENLTGDTIKGKIFHMYKPDNEDEIGGFIRYVGSSVSGYSDLLNTRESSVCGVYFRNPKKPSDSGFARLRADSSGTYVEMKSGGTTVLELRDNYSVISPSTYTEIKSQSGSVFVGRQENVIDGVYITGHEIIFQGNIIYRDASDRNVKYDIEELLPEDALQRILALTPKQFRFKHNKNQKLHHGFIAQEVREVVGDDSASYEYIPNNDPTAPEHFIQYKEFIADLVSVVQTQHQEIETLKMEINKLKEKVNG